ncbi:MAG: cupin domain-containing protein [Chitinophagaceae bacterium]|nr:cupin domain-containing protein [Chitinophagaceae bacterium]
MNFFLQNKPFIVPTTDGKLIEEHFGKVATNYDDLSIARMVAPAGWSELHQVPAFDEWTLVNKGRKLIEIDGQAMVLEAGQSILVKKGARVKYSNPFNEPCDYWSICLPAFTLESVNREEPAQVK